MQSTLFLSVKGLWPRLLYNRTVRFWARCINLHGFNRARVVGIRQETPDIRTFMFERPDDWADFRAGQYVSVGVEVNGRLRRRCYSLSSEPGEPLAITVKRIPGGLVSAWLHARVNVGDYLDVGPPSGNFVLPIPHPANLLLLSGGSGATPVFSILKDLAGKGLIGDVVWLHAAKTAQDVVFGAALLELASEHSGLQVRFVLEDTDGRLDALRLGQMVPDLAERHTMMCGPAGMMEALRPAWEHLDGRLQTEEFTATPRSFSLLDRNGAVQVLFGTKKVTVKQMLPLLDSLEQAGQKPAYGCRMGVCGTCQATKKQGVVENMLTGEVSGEPDEVIRLCVSRPLTDVSLSF